MTKSILVTGGARSGKSAFAERLVRTLGPESVYIATAEAHDAEMAARIEAHRARRGEGWTTREAPLDLVGALDATDGGPRLVDCLTLWLSNLMFAEHDWEAEGRALAEAIPRQSAPVVIVTNEVGSGIVPENALARAYRDAAGQLNQMIAAAVEDVYLTVSGIPVKVKPNDHAV
ncbi:MAG: bifunctional adenosylcobinamide kinase/adenosylcobinamide-phosphate guanylyltransferase [Alphaproteobacteria bacterium]|nr:bifunctional adenosylcobinamide kinase/adenosylcobinamide-phosphate guanylyltransferase [Alphaproteobacteria bacterium]